MHFLLDNLDNDVDAAVGTMLRRRKHACVTARQAGLAAAADDALTLWASDHDAVLVSTDREFGQRRWRHVIGRHLWLRCQDWEAADLLAVHLDEVARRMEAQVDLTIRLSKDGLSSSAKSS